MREQNSINPFIDLFDLLLDFVKQPSL